MPRRAIVVMHGVGDHQKGQTLDDIVEPLVRFLRHYSGTLGRPRDVELEVDMRPEQGSPRATVRFQVEGQAEEWVITEAWWAECFFSNPAGPVLRWGFTALWIHGWAIVYGIALRPLFGVPDDEPPDPVYREPEQNPGRKALSRLWDILVALAVGILYVPASLVIIILAVVFYVISTLPRWLLFPIPAAAAAEALVNSLVSGPGDQYVMTSNYLARSSASRALIKELAPHLNSKLSDYKRCDSVTIIAHSGGAVVSYVALSDPDFKRWDFEQDATVTWFTVGSGLNLAHRMGASMDFWDARLDPRIRWVDVWARYDPVPHGPAIKAMRDRIASDPAIADQCLSVRVSNRDNPFADHGEYWRNYEEVVSRFVYEIMGQPSAGEPLRDMVDKACSEILDHRSGVAKIVALRLAIATIILSVALVTGTATQLGAVAFQGLGKLWFLDEQTVDLISDWRAVFGLSFDTLLGLGLTGLLAYVAYRIVTLFLRDAMERGEDWR